MLVGWGGQLSLGHIAIVGVGAFVAARLAGDSYSLVTIVLLVAALGAGIAVVIGLPALRVRGLTLAVSTLGFAVVASEDLFRSEWFTSSRGRAIPMVPVGILRGVALIESQLSVYYVSLAILAIAMLASAGLRRSTPGRHIIAVRDDEDGIACHGVSPMTIKVILLMVSGSIAAIAGVLSALAWQSVTPEQFAPATSLTILAVPVIGGLGSLWGAVAGAVVIYLPAYLLTEPLTPLLGSAGATAAVQLAVGGVGLVVTLLAYPAGIAGAAQGGWAAYVRRRHAAPDDTSPATRTAARVAGPRLVVGPATAREARATTAGSRSPNGVEPVALRAVELSVRFGGLKALDMVSIALAPGEILGLIGPNGAGKSTLINLMSGLIRPSAGNIELEGRDITRFPPELRSALGLGRSFQAATLFPGLTVQEAIMAVLGAGKRIGVLSSMAHAPWAEQAERELASDSLRIMNRFGLLPVADVLTSKLSTGTRRICDLALQVAHAPKVLLLDEPTGGVAQRESEQFGPLLRSLREELDCSIVIVEHDMPLLMGVCDRIYAMDQGRVIAEGTPAEIRNSPAVIASYLGTDETAIKRSGSAAAPSPSRPPRARRSVVTDRS
jgi:ABC-type branched-subunit amino acid transport system ATPase component/ABC-type branched-subunit amino acid transport system permease subunit